MVLILDGNSEIGVNVNELSLLFDQLKAFHQTENSHESGFFLRKNLFSFIRAHHVLSYHLL